MKRKFDFSERNFIKPFAMRKLGRLQNVFIKLDWSLMVYLLEFSTCYVHKVSADSASPTAVALSQVQFNLENNNRG